MAYVEIIPQDRASDALAQDYAYIAQSYAAIAGRPVPAPQVYTASSLIPAYFHFGAVQNAVLTNHGRHDVRPAGVPNILINFGVSHASSCFY